MKPSDHVPIFQRFQVLSAVAAMEPSGNVVIIQLL